MRLLDRYIGRNVLSAMLATLFALVALIGFVTLLDEAGDAGRGDYGMGDVFLYVLLLLPRFSYELFPVAVLLGSLIGLGGLASHSELIAMRAAGVSLSRIVLAVMKAGVLAMLVMVIIGELVAPVSEQYAEQMRSQQIAQNVTTQTPYGFWARDGDAFINIRYVLSNTHLKDIYIYEFSDHYELQSAIYAADAEYQGSHWLLKDMRQTRFTGDGVVSERLASTTWSSMLNPNILDVVVTRPSVLPAWGLYQYILYLRENGLDARTYEVVFWGKIVSPLVILVMIFLSVPFVFGSLRSVGVGQRIFVGALLGVGFLLLSKAFGNLAVVYQLNPLFAASFPGLLFLGVAFWFVRRIH